MLTWWNDTCLTICDFLLGWTLRLPADLTLVTVAILSAAVLIFIRPLTTDQDLLRRVADDKKRLRQLIHRAKLAGDRESVRRYRRTVSMVGLAAVKSEGLPLLAAILPIAVLATWCMFRLEFHPPRAGEPVALTVYVPVSAAGELVHAVPQDGLDSDGWVRRFEAVTDEGPPYAVATWQLEGPARGDPYAVTFRVRQDTFRHDLLVGQATYSTPLVDHGDQVLSEVRMKPRKLFGVVPGIPALLCPPWLVAYLIIVIPLVPLLKRVTRIH